MNSNQSNPSFSLLLPLLSPKSRLKAGSAGEWQKLQAAVGFEQVADSLALAEMRDIDSVSSIPNMWARPLLIDMVLRDTNHVLHSQIKAQWKGMLAVIALTEVRGFKLRAEFLDLSKLKSDSFVTSLLKLIPAKEKSLYQLEGGQKNPWEEIYVFLWDGKPIGMTSPSTLVCSAEEASKIGLPVWLNGKLRAPQSSNDDLINEDDKTQLWLWLKSLRAELDRNIGDSAKIKEVINEFQEELKACLNSDPSTKQLRFGKKQPFGIDIEGGALKALSIIIGARPRPSSVRLMPPSKQGQPELIFIPDREELTKEWGKSNPNEIAIYETTSIANFNLEEFRKKYKGEYLTKENIFLENFYFLKGPNLLPGALLPQETNITYTFQNGEQNEDQKITPLLPINSKLLDYFTPEELSERIKLEPINIAYKSGVSVSIKLPLSGGEFTVTKNYIIQEDNALTAIPIIELRPNFIAEGWQQYYAFYYDDRLDNSPKTFQASFPEAQEIHAPESSKFKIIRLQSFPSFINCLDDKSKNLGLILLATPRKVGNEDPQKTWTVGVDFGTSFTNVYYKVNRTVNKLSLSPLQLQVTRATAGRRSNYCDEYFMSVINEEFPLSTVLTTKGNTGRNKIVFDGRVYIPPQNIADFHPAEEYILMELKWKTDNIPYNQLFLKHLALLISAEAANNHVREIEWTISYPLAFSKNENNTYQTTWLGIIEQELANTGMIHRPLPPERGRWYRSEGLALAQYFADKEQKDLLYTTCIDMGGGTSDISIWQGNELIHQCSIKLAGKDLFSQFLKAKYKFVEQQFNIELQTLVDENRTESFYVKLDALLLKNQSGQKWLDEKRILLSDNTDLQQIIQLSALGIAGLYYYVGILLRALYLEGKHSRTKITPVCIGGNGSRIFHWLAPSGRYNNYCDDLFSRMLSEGSSFPNTREETKLSSEPKAEVACGLVLDQNQTRLRRLARDGDDIIAGEECKVRVNNGEKLEILDSSRLSFDGNLEFEVEELRNLKSFFEGFINAIRQQKGSSIKQDVGLLRKYQQDEKFREDVWKETKNGLENELLKMNGDANQISFQPPFILGLKSMLSFFAKELAKENQKNQWIQEDDDY